MPNTTLLVFGDCPNNPLTMPLNYDTMGIVQRQSLTNTKGENMNIYITKTADGYTMAIVNPGNMVATAQGEQLMVFAHTVYGWAEINRQEEGRRNRRSHLTWASICEKLANLYHKKAIGDSVTIEV